MVRDPVCGMEVDPSTAFTTRQNAGQTLYFCSQQCVDEFEAEPEKYVSRNQTATNTGDIDQSTKSASVDDQELDREALAAQKEYQSLMRKWWFAAAVGAPTMILSFPQLFPILRDWFPHGSDNLRSMWFVMAVASLAVLVYSGNQFFIGMWQGLKHRSANMHTLIAIGTGVAWVYSTIALLFPQIFPSEEFTEVYYDVTVVVTALVVLGLAMEIKAKGETV